MKIELEIPKEYEKLFKGINVKSIVEKSLKQSLSSEFNRQLLLNLLKELGYKSKPRLVKLSLDEFPKGKVNKKLLRKISEDVKERIARRHRLL